MKLLIFDSETTGLLPKMRIPTKHNIHMFPYIVQFSLVIYDSELNEVTKTIDSIVRVPDYIVISDESASIHGINNTISREQGRCIKDVLNDFINATNEVDMVVAHNIEFDMKCVKVELMRHDMSVNFIDQLQLYCTMKDPMSIELCKLPSKVASEYKYPKLQELYFTLFNETPDKLHNSLYDVIATLRCLVKMNYDRDFIYKSH
jgi:DNA polymerase-3 subunit epsilon